MRMMCNEHLRVREPASQAVQNMEHLTALTLNFLSWQNSSTTPFRDMLIPTSDLEMLRKSYGGWEGGRDQLSEGLD